MSIEWNMAKVARMAFLSQHEENGKASTEVMSTMPVLNGQIKW